MVHYSTDLDITLISAAPKCQFLTNFAVYLYIYTLYDTDLVHNTEIGLGPNSSVIKRLWCTCKP